MQVVRRLAVASAIGLVLYGVGLWMQDGLIEYVQRIVLLAGINVILAVGLNLINGTTGQFSIGHAGFMAVGAYGAAFFGVKLGPVLERLLGVGAVANAITFNIALVIGAALAGVTGLLVGAPSLRLRGDYLAVVTLGFGEIIRISFNNAQFLGAATGYFGDTPAGLPPYTTTFFWVYGWAIAIIVLIRNLTFSQTGRSLAATREDEIAAEAMATPTTRLKVLAFCQRGQRWYCGWPVRVHAIGHPPRRLSLRQVDRHDRRDHHRWVGFDSWAPSSAASSWPSRWS